MPRTVETEPLSKHVLRLYRGDFERLASYYPELGPSVAVRHIVRAQLTALDAKVGDAPELKESLDV